MTGQLEKRGASAPQAQGRKLAGYAAVFDQPADVAGFVEVIKPGAFRDSLADRDILAMIDHQPSKILGRTKSGTLRLWEDARGLAFEIDLPDTSAGRDLLALAERGDLGGCSFGFTVPEGGQRWDQGKRREITRAVVHEISIVHAWPAYSGTSVEARQKAPRLAQARRFMETV
ncbi:MAG: HK97 family phage prohead protease [Candidatus Adiutrix sp.]|jgi:HK97 family phage prohead protease|nr:HK97 family phage prohead protease [Candidatus Adiutrix sp.]